MVVLVVFGAQLSTLLKQTAMNNDIGIFKRRPILRTQLFCILIVISAASCIESRANKPIDDARLITIYQNLNLVHFSPDYPAHPEVFNHCANAREEGCYRVIQRVKLAVSELKALNNETALEYAINAIERYCHHSTTRNDPDAALCEGALTSIYLFNSKNDDAILINGFKSLSKDKNIRIFDGNQEWFYNRKDVTPWKNYIKSMLDGNALELQLWRFSQKNVKPFGLMFFESPIPAGDNLTY